MLPNHTTFINEVTQFMVSHNSPPPFFFKYLWFALTNRVKVCHHIYYVNLRADRSADTMIRCGWKCEVKITGEVCRIWQLPVSHCWETYLSTVWKVTMSKLDELVWWAVLRPVFTIHSLLSDKDRFVFIANNAISADLFQFTLGRCRNTSVWYPSWCCPPGSAVSASIYNGQKIAVTMLDSYIIK